MKPQEEEEEEEAEGSKTLTCPLSSPLSLPNNNNRSTDNSSNEIGSSNFNLLSSLSLSPTNNNKPNRPKPNAKRIRNC